MSSDQDSLSTPSTTKSSHTFPLEDCEVETASVDAIVAACKKAPSITKHGSGVRRISESVAVKFCEFLCLSEARAMQLVDSRTTVRVPKVIRSFEVLEPSSFGDETKVTYIVMEYIHGQCLDDCWNDMADVQHQAVCNQVVDAISKLQLLELDRPGPIGGGLSTSLLLSRYDAGPFKTVRELEDWFTHKLDVCRKFKQAPPDAIPFTDKFGKMVMSHLDITPRNIILGKDGELCLIDWGFAGGYPIHFERAALLDQHYFPDFSERILVRLEPYEQEIKALKSVSWAIKMAPLA